jgi:hypothetical protein
MLGLVWRVQIPLTSLLGAGEGVFFLEGYWQFVDSCRYSAKFALK